MPTHAAARDKRAALYIEEPEYFLARLQAELQILQADARRLGLTPAARLNGSSDIPWERLHPDIFGKFPDMQFFDYTKILGRMHNYLGIGKRGRNWPRNYHLTFSGDSVNQAESQQILRHGGNVALVFWPELPRAWWEHSVLDGDLHDARFLDAGRTVVGLLAKGAARIDQTGFTIHTGDAA